MGPQQKYTSNFFNLISFPSPVSTPIPPPPSIPKQTNRFSKFIKVPTKPCNTVYVVSPGSIRSFFCIRLYKSISSFRITALQLKHPSTTNRKCTTFEQKKHFFMKRITDGSLTKIVKNKEKDERLLVFWNNLE